MIHFNQFLCCSATWYLELGMKTGYYAVVRGRCTGVYKTWSECERQVKGYRNARLVFLQSKLLK